MAQARKLDPMIVEILNKWHPDPNAALWDCHGRWVLYHKAVEVMAAAAKITFDMPVFAAIDLPTKNVAIVVSASLGDKKDWAIGEASPANNKNAYPFAMAEKRARDRVAIKLLGLHGVYSEEEADDFRRRDEEPEPAPKPPLRGKVMVESGPQEPPSLTERAVAMEKRLVAAKTTKELEALWRSMADDLKPAFRARVAALGEALKAEEEV